MYDDWISNALDARKVQALENNAQELINKIRYTADSSIKMTGAKKYSEEFLRALRNQGIKYSEPTAFSNTWYFQLPVMEDN